MQRQGVLMLAVLAGVSGCAGFNDPTVSVTAVTLTDVTDEALALSFVMDLANPNPAALPLHEFRYTLAIDGKEVYAGRRAGGVTLSAADSRRVSLPAIVPFELVGWTPGTVPASVEYTFTGRLQYNAPNRLAQLLLDTGTRQPKVSFAAKGELELR